MSKSLTRHVPYCSRGEKADSILNYAKMNRKSVVGKLQTGGRRKTECLLECTNKVLARSRPRRLKLKVYNKEHDQISMVERG
jgi:hypothetical protein